MEFLFQLLVGIVLGALIAVLAERSSASQAPAVPLPDTAAATAAPAAEEAPTPQRSPRQTLPQSPEHAASMMSRKGNWRSSSSASDVPHADCSMLVFSGGTAFNAYVHTLAREMENVTYVLPVSDNGGSTAEILRVLGGPAIGDIRSRLLRLSSVKTDEARAVLDLLQFRLPIDWDEARTAWSAIVDGTHRLWTTSISDTYKQMIRTFLVHFHCEVLQQDRGTFDFTNGSVGNFFFTGARMFFDSLEAAIFLWSRLAAIPLRSAVVPVINTNRQMTLVAQLDDVLGTTLHGQQAISHPVEALASAGRGGGRRRSHTVVDKAGSGQHSLGARIRCVVRLRRALPQRVLWRTALASSLARSPSPHHRFPLPPSLPLLVRSRSRIWYVNEERHLIKPAINPAVLEKMAESQLIVYGMGSLWTSIMPCLLLAGTGKAIAAHSGRKVLLLNSAVDRESGDMDASAIIKALTTVIGTNEGTSTRDGFLPLLSLITDVLVPRATQVRASRLPLRTSYESFLSHM